MKMTMVDFKRKFLNDYLMNTSIRVVEMTAGEWGWNWSKRNIILLEIKKVRAIRWNYFVLFCSTYDFVDRNGP